MKTILVGFDESEQARDALHLANFLAQEEGAELIVATVFSVEPMPIPPMAPMGFFTEQNPWFEKLFDAARRQLGRDVETRSAWGSPARALNDFAEAEKADLIVVGSAHHGKLGRALAGSVGEMLLHGAPCAVAVAPRGYADRDHLQPSVIGVAYDGTEESKVALREASALAQSHDCSLRLISVLPDQAPSPMLGDYMPALREHFARLQSEALEELDGAITVDLALEEGDPAEVLAMRGVELDLLVIGSRGYGPLRRTLLGGVSEKVIRTAPCPVIVVPRSAQSHVAETLSWSVAEGERPHVEVTNTAGASPAS